MMALCTSLHHRLSEKLGIMCTKPCTGFKGSAGRRRKGLASWHVGACGPIELLPCADLPPDSYYMMKEGLMGTGTSLLSTFAGSHMLA